MFYLTSLPVVLDRHILLTGCSTCRYVSSALVGSKRPAFLEKFPRGPSQFSFLLCCRMREIEFPSHAMYPIFTLTLQDLHVPLRSPLLPSSYEYRL